MLSFQFGDDILVVPDVGGLFDPEDLLSLAGLHRASVIGQDQLVTFSGMLEEIENPFLFHEPGHKIQVGLPVLNAVFPG